MRLHNLKWLRRIVLPLFSWLNPGDIVIRHHWTEDRITPHSFRHKDYWYHGRRREQRTMELFAQIIQPGDCVCDVGAHIGYVSLYFRRLAGLGRVYVFEPGQNNLPYLRANVEGTGIRLVEKAVGDHDGEVRFFLESSTGQNNSMVKDFQGLQANARIAYVAVEVREILVPLIRLDTFFAHEAVTPAFIKVDVEGAELGVLRGAAGLIARAKPAWMVEVQAEAPEILAMLSGAGYLVFAQDRRRLALADRLRGNVFALHAERHEPLIAKLGLT